MMERYDLVVFDCDGVVVDSEVLSCQCLADVLSQHGLSIGIEEVFARFLGRTLSDVDAYYLAQRGSRLPTGFRDEFRRRLNVSFRDSLKPVPHVVEVINALACPYCMASSSDVDRIRLALTVTGLDSLFDGRIFSSAMVDRGKPAPDLFLFAAQQMGVPPARTVVVEDSEVGVMAGKAAGMIVLGYTGGSHHDQGDAGRRLTEAGADRILTSMAEFPLQ